MAGEIQEICLFWGGWQIQRWWSCMNKTEWSGWIQAMGTAIAFFSLLVPISIERLRRKKKEKEKYKSIMARCISIIHEIKSFQEAVAITLFSISFGGMDSPTIEDIRDNFDKISSRLEVLPYWEMPNDEVIADMQHVLKSANAFRISIIHRSKDAPSKLHRLHEACIKAEASLTGNAPTLW